jgi:hypothetical protein
VSRLHRLLVVFAPGVLAGALIASATIGEAQPTPRPAPAPRPTPGRPAVIVDGNVELPPEARDQIRAELERAMAEIDSNDDIPPKMRARLHRALAKARASNMKDLAKLGDALQQMSGELEGLGDELREELPAIQQEIERALRQSGVARKAGRVRIVDPHGSAWSVTTDDDDDDDDDDEDEEDADDARKDFDFDVDVDDGSVRIRPGPTPDGPAGPWMRRWQGMTPPIPPVPPVPPTPPAAPPAPPAPPTPPTPPTRGAVRSFDRGPIGSDPFDVDVGVDLGGRGALTNRQVEDLRKITTAASGEIDAAQQAIASKSDELRALVAANQVDEDRVNRLVDEIAEQEARLHKARLRALIYARRVLQGR